MCDYVEIRDNSLWAKVVSLSKFRSVNFFPNKTMTFWVTTGQLSTRQGLLREQILWHEHKKLSLASEKKTAGFTSDAISFGALGNLWNSDWNGYSLENTGTCWFQMGFSGILTGSGVQESPNWNRAESSDGKPCLSRTFSILRFSHWKSQILRFFSQWDVKSLEWRRLVVGVWLSQAILLPSVWVGIKRPGHRGFP